MEQDTLNKKLAEWAGFSHIEGRWWRKPEGTFEYRDGVAWEASIVLPNFIANLSPCFKWLVPKLEPMGYDLDISNDLELMGWSVCLHNTKSECSIASPMEHCELEGITLALCKAIERAIDSEVNNGEAKKQD